MIELTKVQFAVSGSGSTQKIIRTEKSSSWVNPSVICYFEQKFKWIGSTRVDVTELTWSNGRLGNTITVAETPDEIIQKIRLSRVTYKPS